MAQDKRISDLTALTTPADGDLIPIVDVSDTTDASSGTTKKIAMSSIFPASATDGNLVVFDGTTGKKLKDGGSPTVVITASAYKSASNQSVNTDSTTEIVLDVENFDTGSNFASNRFTATVAGYYQVHGSLTVQAPEDQKYYITILAKNTNRFAQETVTASGTSDICSSVSSIVYLGVGDYVNMYLYHNSTGAINVLKGAYLTQFSVAKI
jgi:hypothetical protein